MTRTRTLLALAAAAALTPALSTPAHACGGFACDGSGVVQTGERLLFSVDELSNTTTMVVEVQYAGSPTGFAWVLPVPGDVTLDDVGTVDGGLFDALEEETAPRFVEFVGDGEASGSSFGSCFGPVQSSSGSSSAAAGSEDSEGLQSSEVRLLGEATIGAYEVDLISTFGAEGLEDWLVDNGYVIPDGFAELAAPYIASNMRFLGLQLDPDAASGVLEPVSIQMMGTNPSIPLVLTSISASTNMEVTAYVAANERYAPVGWTDLEFDWGAVELLEDDWVGTYSNYTVLLEETVELAGGRAFVTEFAGPSAGVVSPSSAAGAWLGSGSTLTRLRTFVDPGDMTTDPSFEPSLIQADQNNVHLILPDVDERATASVGLLMLLLAVRRRRNA
ncbi:MAG: DUF2330 domain-containing protein [Proteobacteria bacterium]|nr:DUF2330 domain-containing protein [Pseudomonadota bacterium]